MTQLDLFEAPPPGLLVRWDPAGDGLRPYNKIVRRHFTGFEYILYDMRIGSIWHRVLITTAGTRRDPHLCVGSYAEPAAECNPLIMTLVANWEFDIQTPPSDVAKAIIDGAMPVWTWKGRPA